MQTIAFSLVSSKELILREEIIKEIGAYAALMQM